MSSEHLASAQVELKGDLGASWNILDGASANYTDLGIARRFGGATSAYSLRDIGAMNGNVVQVRRMPNDTDTTINDEENFSANQVKSGALEDWVNGKLESTLPCDVATAYQAYSLRKVRAGYSGNAVRVRRSSDDAEVNVAFDSDGNVSTSSSISVVSGSVSGTTFGDFISGDVFVHTWYDQVGSNDVTQPTAGNQPKIAESGALLTDGLKFDGTDDMLTDSDVGAMQASDGMSSFVVHKKTSASTSTSFTTTNPQYLYHLCESELANTVLAHRILGGKLNILRANEAGDDFIQTTTTNHLITTTKNLSTAIGSSGFQNHLNATTPAEDVEESGTTFDSTTTEFTIGAQDGIGGSSTRFYDGQIEELIIYKSDQTDNRFKIESNINNYYNLYNDELYFSGNVKTNTTESTITKSDGTTETVTNGSTVSTGLKNSIKYTIGGETSTGNRFHQFLLSDLGESEISKLANGEKVYISFFVEADTSDGLAFVVDFRDGFTTLTNNFQTGANKGFFSAELTRNATASDDDGDECLMIQTSGVANATIHITGIKASLIARNGFVHSWYDQSGNGRTMVQATAADQPHIVENGAICKDPSGNNPTIKFVNIGTNLGSTFLKVITPSLVPTIPDAMTQFFIASTNVNPTGDRFTFSGSDSDSCIDDRRLELRRGAPGGENKESPSLELSDFTNSLLVYNTNASKIANFHLNGSSDSASGAFTGTLNEDAFEVLGENSSSASNDTFGLQGTISEAILYTYDLGTDITTLKNEMNNYYNCY